MSEETPRSNRAEGEAPAAEVRAKRSFSIIWVVPLVALVIGGWLAYKAFSEKGPTIRQDQDQVQGCRSRRGHGYCDQQ
jgi:paraquat-inducible protein B